MSVIAPPEVERPYDHGWEPSAERVTRYRTWTRTKQVTQLSVTLPALVLATAVCVVGGQPPWDPSGGTLALLVLVMFAAFLAVEVFWDGRSLRGRVAAAEPLPDGALEIGAPTLFDRTVLLQGVLFGPVLGAVALLIGHDLSQTVIAVIVGLGAGRIVGLELLLRLVVERADPLRTFFVSLDADELDAPLLWRSAL